MPPRPKVVSRGPIPQAAPLPMPLPAFTPMARPRRPKWKWLFAGVFGLMMILGFEVGFKAGTSKPTPPKKPVLVAAKPSAKITKPDPDPPIREPETAPKSKIPELKEPQAKTPDPKEPEAKVTPEPSPEPKTEPKMEKKTEPKMEAKTEPKTPPKTEPKMEAKKPLVPAKPGMEVTFNKVVAIFKDKCVNCHGGASKKAELDVRSAKEAIKGGDTGPGIKPGDPANSLIWQMIEEGTMPPKGKPQLTVDEKKLIKDWIAGGAKP